jgi:hypothetical protein
MISVERLRNPHQVRLQHRLLRRSLGSGSVCCFCDSRRGYESDFLASKNGDGCRALGFWICRGGESEIFRAATSKYL